jgi:signal transduction histidine kinase
MGPLPLGAREQRQDLLLAAALTVFGVAEALAWPALSRGWTSATQPIDIRDHLALAVVTLGFTATLALRRRFPVPVLAVAVLCGLMTANFNHQGGALALVLGVAIASFTVGHELDLPASLWGPAIATFSYWAVYALIAHSTQASDYFFTLLLYTPPWIFGAALRVRTERLREATERAAELEAKQGAAAAAAAEEERQRIARELHDVVSHSITVIAIQAQAVRHRLRPDQNKEADDLQLLETTARQAMAEMRRLFGVIRKDGEGPGLAPQPGLAQLPALVDDLRASGLAVEVHENGPPAELPPGLDLAAYRVLQEALTNVLRHAGAGAQAVVRITYDPKVLRLSVEDDGIGGGGRVGTGHGLIGMRERIALYGGTLEAGSTNGVGFKIRVSIPLRDVRMA